MDFIDGNPQQGVTMQAILREQLAKLDPDLTILVVVSCVSLNLKHIVKTVSLANQIMLERNIKKSEKPLTPEEQENFTRLELLFHNTYTDKNALKN